MEDGVDEWVEEELSLREKKSESEEGRAFPNKIRLSAGELAP